MKTFSCLMDREGRASGGMQEGTTDKEKTVCYHTILDAYKQGKAVSRPKRKMLQ